MLSHPAHPSCKTCLEVMHDDHWQPVRRLNLPVKRPPGSRPPCWKCPRIPKGDEPKPENGINLSRRNQQALWFFKQCREDVRGDLPRDEVTLRNHAIIQTVHEADSRARADLGPLLVALFGGKKS